MAIPMSAKSCGFRPWQADASVYRRDSGRTPCRRLTSLFLREDALAVRDNGRCRLHLSSVGSSNTTATERRRFQRIPTATARNTFWNFYQKSRHLFFYSKVKWFDIYAERFCMIIR